MTRDELFDYAWENYDVPDIYEDYCDGLSVGGIVKKYHVPRSMVEIIIEYCDETGDIIGRINERLERRDLSPALRG